MTMPPRPGRNDEWKPDDEIAAPSPRRVPATGAAGIRVITPDERSDLTDLVHRYALNADRRAFDELSLLFTDAGSLVVPDPPSTLQPEIYAHGRAEIADACRSLGRLHATQHAVVGCVFDAGDTPDDATGVVACIAHHVSGKPDSIVDHVWHLHYRDRYRRVDGRWSIARREVWVDWIEQRTVLARREATGV